MGTTPTSENAGGADVASVAFGSAGGAGVTSVASGRTPSPGRSTPSSGSNTSGSNSAQSSAVTTPDSVATPPHLPFHNTPAGGTAHAQQPEMFGDDFAAALTAALIGQAVPRNRMNGDGTRFST